MDERKDGCSPSTARIARGAVARALVTLAALACGALPGAAAAQYFGRNKVVWEEHDFEVLETEHFLIHYYPSGAAHASYVARIAERWYARLADFFDHELAEKKSLVIYVDHADFQQTVITPSLIGEGTGGLTESQEHRVVLPLTPINSDNDHVIGHELVHVFQFDIIDELRRNPSGNRSAAQVPLWVVEGLAEYLSQGRHDPATALQLRDAVLHDDLPYLDRLVQRQPSPYQYGQAIWAYVAGRWDDATARELFVTALSRGPGDAIESVLDLMARDFFNDFHFALRAAYGDVLDARDSARAVAERLLSQATTGAAVNLAPALSPDGRRVAFLSTRELALELYLADVATGKIERKLVSADADPHFDNLSFLDSSVAWSPDGRRLAFGVFARGDRRLAIYDVERDRIERRIDVPDIEGMRHPAWSPDGRSIVFSARTDGASDLYRLDLATNEVERLTSDGYTDIQPAFSPDGRRIVFVTDRGPATSLDLLRFGEPQLALLDLETRAIEVLQIFPSGKHIDPHFSPDGESLYFIGEPDGVPDVFRYDLAERRALRVTRLKTGVSGLTSTSPALSIDGDGALAFSVQEGGDFNIYRIAEPHGEAVHPAEPPLQAAILPPYRPIDAESTVERYLADARGGLPEEAAQYPTRDYESKLGLIGIGPAIVGVTTSGTGSGFDGAFSALFGDTLNRHQIVTTVQGGSSSDLLDFEDTIGAEALYLNQAHRWWWGARASRIPYAAGATFLSRQNVEIDGTSVPADVVERVVEAAQVSEVSLLGQYPFSSTQRLETFAGVQRIDFERELERIVYPFGFEPFRETLGLPSPATLDLDRASLAYVRDTSRFGFASPVRGDRLRLEHVWTSGDLRFSTLGVDYRRYFFRRPLTFALRALHIGRSGRDAEDPRLTPLDIGTNTLVRGYDLGSFDLDECTPAPAQVGCPEFDRLIGSKIAALNFELRLPLFGTEDFGLFELPAAPTELAFFIDAGAAWSKGESVEVTFERDTTELVPVFSAGVAARTVLLGSVPVELFVAYPFQRKRGDAVFGFRLGVGW